MPVIIQGLGARSKVDAPTAGWDNAKRFVDDATDAGRRRVLDGDVEAVQPHVQPRRPAPSSTRARSQLNRLFTEATTVDERIALLADPAFRDADPRLGRPPEPGPGKRPHAAAARTGPCCTSTRCRKPENEKLVGRSLVDIAAERGVHPTDALLDIALSEDLARRVPLEDRDARVDRGHPKIAQADPHMIVGTSDGGAHLDRDDGAEAHT